MANFLLRQINGTPLLQTQYTVCSQDLNQYKVRFILNFVPQENLSYLGKQHTSIIMLGGLSLYKLQVYPIVAVSNAITCPAPEKTVRNAIRFTPTTRSTYKVGDTVTYACDTTPNSQNGDYGRGASTVEHKKVKSVCSSTGAWTPVEYACNCEYRKKQSTDGRFHHQPNIYALYCRFACLQFTNESVYLHELLNNLSQRLVYHVTRINGRLTSTKIHADTT